MRDDTNASLLLEEVAELRRQNAELKHQNINLMLSLADYQIMAEQRQAERTLHQSEERFEIARLTLPDAPANVAFISDITEQERAQQEIREQLHFLQVLIDAIPAPIFYKDPNGSYQGCNSAWLAVHGMRKAEMIGKTVYDIYPEEQADQYHRMDKELFDSPGTQVYEYKMRFVADGMNHDVILHKATYADSTGCLAGLVGVMIDITERKQAEQSLRSSEERFSKAFDSGPCMMAIISIPDYRFVYVNQYWLSAVGYALDEVIGKAIVEIGHWPESQFQQIIGFLEQRGSVHNLDIIFRNRRGGQRYGLWSGETITINGERCLLGVTIDITELKQFEQEMARLDRLDLVGEMAAGLAHEIRNPLTVVRGYLQLLQYKEEFISHHKKFNTMIEEIDRANAIITEFLSLARHAPVDLRRQSINNIVSALLPLIQVDAAKNGITISIDLAETPELCLDEKQIRQLVLNLVRNGIEAMSRYGELTIKTRHKRSGVELIIKDRGKGIPPEVLEKLGTPFFTTKEKGTGLGLPVCYRIAENHHAKIQIRTGARGTTFIVRFKIIPCAIRA